eukprot:1858781-Lingulodinium_polyedra.AAC.1
MGVDALRPSDVLQLPADGRQRLLDIFGCMEQRLAWPWQLLMALVHLAPKGGGADRGLFAFPFLARLWSNLRGEAPDQ